MSSNIAVTDMMALMGQQLPAFLAASPQIAQSWMAFQAALNDAAVVTTLGSTTANAASTGPSSSTGNQATVTVKQEPVDEVVELESDDASNNRNSMVESSTSKSPWWSKIVRNTQPSPAPRTSAPAPSPSQKSPAPAKVPWQPGNGIDIPRHEIECDLEQLLAEELRDLLVANSEDRKVFEDEEEEFNFVTPSRYLKLLTQGIDRPRFPIYKKGLAGKRRYKKRNSLTTVKKIRSEEVNESDLSSLNETSFIDSDLDEPLLDDQREIEVGDLTYNDADEPANDAEAYMRSYCVKKLEPVKNRRLPKYTIDLDKVEFNKTMARNFPQVDRTESDKQKRLRNTTAARISRLRNKADAIISKSSIGVHFEQNIYMRRTIACTGAYMKKLAALAGVKDEDMQEIFNNMFMNSHIQEGGLGAEEGAAAEVGGYSSDEE